MGKAQPQATIESPQSYEETPQCPECGEEINGINAVGPSTHQYAGCGHDVNGHLTLHESTQT